MLPEKLKAMLKKQHYAIIGKHSAVQICKYTKDSIRGKNFCYKQKFYGIQSHRCVQMTPCVMWCQHKCLFCWRPIEKNLGHSLKGKVDEPKEIIEKCIEAQRKQLLGFGGSLTADKKKLKEAMEPKHFAISLSGEPTIYPKLPELIKELEKRKISSFVVSNGEIPEMIKKINPTQLYISVDAPNEKLFNKIDRPCNEKYGWKNLIKTLKILKSKKKTRTVLRLTLIKGLNMVEPENYAELIKISDPMFVEVKSYMAVGFSRQRFGEPKCVEIMPTHSEVKDFAKEICKFSGYKIIDEKENSRVVLLMKHDRKDRIMRFEK
jgi:tRNA wybutosine-synthesizing protein 1